MEHKYMVEKVIILINFLAFHSGDGSMKESDIEEEETYTTV